MGRDGEAIFRALCWKNWKVFLRGRKNHIIGTVIPILFAVLLAWFRGMAANPELKCTNQTDDIQTCRPTSFFVPLQPDFLPDEPPTCPSQDQQIYYTETQDSGSTGRSAEATVRDAVEYIKNSSSSSPALFANADLVSVPGEPAMLAQYSNLTTNETFNPGCFIGISFTGPTSFSLRLPYTPGGFTGQNNPPRSWLTSETMETNQFWQQGPRIGPNSNKAGNSPQFGGTPGYPVHTFLTMQWGLSKAIANRTVSANPSAESPEKLERLFNNVYLQRMPFPEYEDNPWPALFMTIGPAFLLVGWLYASSTIARDIAGEKDLKLKGALIMMGVKLKYQWISWWVRGLAPMMVTWTLIAIVLSAGHVIEQTSFTIVLTFGYVTGAATMSLACLITTLVQKASVAAILSVVVGFLTYIPYATIFSDPATVHLSMGEQQTICLASMSCFSVGLASMAQFDMAGKPLVWSHLGESEHGYLPVGTCMLYLLFDAAVYFLLALYIEQVRPGDYGVPRSPWFPLQDLLACFRHDAKNGIQLHDMTNEEARAETDRHVVRELRDESIQEHREPGIRVTNLTKEFVNSESDSVKRAVDGLSMELFPETITAFLGANGAGKTTTMSMLCGLFPPTSGSMQVAGFDIATNLGAAQCTLGVCPQHDVLWDDLTVEQHLILFARLKGLRDLKVTAAVSAMIEDLQLVEKRDTLSKDLSGGQRRRLSVGVALIGGSTVVILDEPSSGCDPEARQAIWALLLAHKAGRTILLSTHFMDEADELGDQIAILATGKLVCMGSSLFLKGQYGVGHNLTVAKLPGCDDTLVKTAVLQHIPTATVLSEVGSELQLKVPTDKVGSLPGLLRELDASRTDLKIDSFGVSATTLEEVFLTAGVSAKSTRAMSTSAKAARISSGMEAVSPTDGSSQPGGDAYGVNESDVDTLTTKLLPDGGHDTKPFAPVAKRDLLQQVAAVRAKRWMLFRRNRFPRGIMVVLPAAFIIYGAYQNYTAPAPDADNGAPVGVSTLYMYGENTLNLFSCSDSQLCAYAKQTALASGGSPQEQDGTLQQFVKNLKTSEVTDFNMNNLLALTFSSPASATASGTTTAWFNGQTVHGPAQALSVAVNTFMRSFNASEIHVTNAPLPMTPKEAAAAGNSLYAGASAFGPMLVFGLLFFAAGAVDLPVTERGTNVKHIQLNSGLGFGVYWLANFTFDFTIGVALSVLAVLIVSTGTWAIFDSGSGVVFCAILLGFASIIILSYLISNAFKLSASAIKTVIFGGMFLGYIPLMVVTSLSLIPKTADVATIVGNVFLFSPFFCVGQLIVALALNLAKVQHAEQILRGNPPSERMTTDQLCDVLGCTVDNTSLELPGVGRYLLALVGQCVVYSGLLYAVESGWFRMWFRPSAPISTSEDELDTDVAEEHRRVQELIADDNAALSAVDPIVVDRAVKNFGAKVAVDRVSFAISPGELFGLLGVNGAGKTTTFKMLTGEIGPSAGKIAVEGLDVTTRLKEVQQLIGYVPQFDALIGDFTGKEVLAYFAKLRGLHPADIPAEVERLVRKLDLTVHADNHCKKYSGGNKRKLCIALALIGDPPILLLDEPTTGMDPGSKRFVWEVLLELIREGRTIVLTTHSMEEAAALSTRIGIMVAGQLRCLGSQQHLKERFGKAIYVEMVGDSMEQPISRMQASFPNLTVKSQGSRKATLVVDGTDGAAGMLAELFDKLLALRQGGYLQDFTVSQCTLDQIFIQQAKDYA